VHQKTISNWCSQAVINSTVHQAQSCLISSAMGRVVWKMAEGFPFMHHKTSANGVPKQSPIQVFTLHNAA
jgi:hypothetical protein